MNFFRRPLHQNLAVIFGGFCSFVFLYNWWTPGNPDHLLNLVEMSVLAGVFFASFYAPRKLAEVLHVTALGIGGLIPMGLADQVNLGPVVVIFSIALAHAYGGFRQHAMWKLPATLLVTYMSMAFALGKLMPPTLESYTRAAVYTLFVVVFFVFAWIFERYIIQGYEERERELLAEKAEILADKAELIEQNRELLARCGDGPGEK
jgi:hypothetical protein